MDATNDATATDGRARPAPGYPGYTPPPALGQALDSAELAALRRTWYAEAHACGDLALLGRVGRELGREVPARYGPKYAWARDGVAIAIDDYGKFLETQAAGRTVCSTHATARLFVPGPWLDVVRGARRELERERDARAAEAEAARRRTLRRDLDLDR